MTAHGHEPLVVVLARSKTVPCCSARGLLSRMVDLFIPFENEIFRILTVELKKSRGVGDDSGTGHSGWRSGRCRRTSRHLYDTLRSTPLRAECSSVPCTLAAHSAAGPGDRVAPVRTGGPSACVQRGRGRGRQPRASVSGSASLLRSRRCSQRCRARRRSRVRKPRRHRSRRLSRRLRLSRR
jgi:hypothetical protein